MSDSEEERRYDSDSDSESDRRRYMENSVDEEKPKEYPWYHK